MAPVFRLAPAVLFLFAACGPKYAMDPAVVKVVRLPPDPPPLGTYAPRALPSAKVQLCAQRGLEAEDEAKCLLGTFEEAALPVLLDLAIDHESSWDPRDPTAFADDVSAADDAGKIAAATRPDELFAMLGDPSPAAQGFALRALTVMLTTEAHAAGYPALAARTAAACAALLGSDEGRVAVTAGVCVATAKDAASVPALAHAFAVRPESAFKAQTGWAVKGLPKGTIADADLRALAEYLKSPMPEAWWPDERDGRDVACAVLAEQVDGEPEWATSAARIAWENVRRKTDDWGPQATTCGRYSKMIPTG